MQNHVTSKPWGWEDMSNTTNTQNNNKQQHAPTKDIQTATKSNKRINKQNTAKAHKTENKHKQPQTNKQTDKHTTQTNQTQSS